MNELNLISKNYDSIDVMKFVASIAIIAIHSDALLDIDSSLNNYICQGLFRIAVPLFFLSTAYFFFQKALNKNTISNYIIRLAILYVCWFIITLPITIFNRIYCSNYNIPVTIFRFIRGFIFSSTFGGSWYLMSCLACGILFYNLNKIDSRKLKIVIIVLISIYSYLLPVLCSVYGNLMNQIPYFKKIYQYYEMFFTKPYNSILVGIPYFAIMYYCKIKNYSFLIKSKKSCQSKNQKIFYFYMAGFISFVLFILEIFIVNNYCLKRASDCYLLLFPVSLCLFIFLLNLNINFIHSKKIRIYSTIIYFSHFIWLFLLEFSEWVLKIQLSHISKFILGSTMSLLGAFVLLHLQKKNRFQWIKYLY